MKQNMNTDEHCDGEKGFFVWKLCVVTRDA